MRQVFARIYELRTLFVLSIGSIAWLGLTIAGSRLGWVFIWLSVLLAHRKGPAHKASSTSLAGRRALLDAQARL